MRQFHTNGQRFLRGNDPPQEGSDLPVAPPKIDLAVPGASPWDILNQSCSPFWEAQGFRTPHIRIAVASGRIESIRST